MDEQRLQMLEAWTQREYALHDNLGCEHACVSCGALVETRAVIAEVRRLRQDRFHWTRHIADIADQRDAALAERDALRADLVRGQLHGPCCPYREGDEDSCTCRPEELAARWKSRWILDRAALTEARRVLRDVLKAHSHMGVSVDWLHAEIAAVLAQEEK